jgi:hypothetical protein
MWKGSVNLGTDYTAGGVIGAKVSG